MSRPSQTCQSHRTDKHCGANNCTTRQTDGIDINGTHTSFKHINTYIDTNISDRHPHLNINHVIIPIKPKRLTYTHHFLPVVVNGDHLFVVKCPRCCQVQQAEEVHPTSPADPHRCAGVGPPRPALFVLINADQTDHVIANGVSVSMIVALGFHYGIVPPPLWQLHSHLHTHTHTHTLSHTHIHTHTHTRAHTHTHTCIHTHAHTHTHTHTHIHTHAHAHIHAHTHTRARTHTHIHTYIHAQTHTIMYIIIIIIEYLYDSVFGQMPCSFHIRCSSAILCQMTPFFVISSPCIK